MTYQATPSHLEEFFVEIEGFDKKVYNSTTNAPPRLLEGFIEEIEGFDEVRLESVKDSIIHRVNAMLRYVFAVCQSKPEKKPKADKAVEQLAFIAKSRDPETTDVVSAMSIIAKTNTFDSDVSEALIIMEETLHEGKDKDKPAAGKQTLRELLVRHAELASKAA